MNEDSICLAYEYAKAVYAAWGVDTDEAMAAASKVPVSMHSWQGDDLIGFEGIGKLTGGISATGNYPGRATTAQELRADIQTAFSLIPGTKRLNLHACHAETAAKPVGRDAISIAQFQNWVDWAKEMRCGIDFNPTFFSYPMMDGDFSLASPKRDIREYWIEHGKRCLEIGVQFGKQLNTPCVVNYWMPDGFKDIPVDTKSPRELMAASLDAILENRPSETLAIAAIESKLFGLGIESHTVASHEFSLGYAITRGIYYCLDMGHFHPTEQISDKLSAILLYAKGILLHASRGVRWDSDHVVLYDDEMKRVMCELVNGDYLSRVRIGQDYFDASINRIMAWVIGMRNTQKALLYAFLQPASAKKAEQANDFSTRLATLEEMKTLPFGPIWDMYCLRENVPVGENWIDTAKAYERDVLLKR